jgi:hypothetical protein
LSVIAYWKERWYRIVKEINTRNENTPNGANHEKFQAGRGFVNPEPTKPPIHSMMSIDFQTSGMQDVRRSHDVVHPPEVEKLA